MEREITGTVHHIYEPDEHSPTQRVVVKDLKGILYTLDILHHGMAARAVRSAKEYNLVLTYTYNDDNLIIGTTEPDMSNNPYDATAEQVQETLDYNPKIFSPPEMDATTLGDILARIFGEHMFDDGVEKTAKRVLGYWAEMGELCSKEVAIPGEVALPFEFTTFKSDPGQIVCVPGIEFSSLCAHHLLPFMGVAHVAYIANKLQVGLSKIPRLVDFWARRPQVQERLTAQIAKDLKERLNPHGVMVVIEASHSCMSCRGVRKHNGAMVTSRPEGMFMSNPSARDEFFELIRPHRIR
jgi:GTP cyclohydrolase I